jgi:hypothetical protein
MKTRSAEAGGTLLGALFVGVLLAMLGGVAMNLAMTETTASACYLEEKRGQALAESGVEQVVAWLTHGDLPLSGGASVPERFTGTADHPDVEFDAARSDDDRVLHDAGTSGSRALSDLGRVVRMRLYGSVRPEGFCTVEVTAESLGGTRRTVSVELGAVRIPPLHAAVQYGVPPVGAGETEGHSYPTVLAHGGEIQESAPGLPPAPWQYQAFKELARRFGTYYVPDREGRLYKDGTMDPSAALAPADVFGSRAVGDQRGLVFVDTLDQKPPTETNLATLALDSSYLEGTFYVNANVVLRPEGQGMTIQGVSHVAGTLRVEGPSRVFGAVTAERGLAGGGLLEVWYNHDLGRGLVRGLPVVFPLRGSWREWGT